MMHLQILAFVAQWMIFLVAPTKDTRVSIDAENCIDSDCHLAVQIGNNSFKIPLAPSRLQLGRFLATNVAQQQSRKCKGVRMVPRENWNSSRDLNLPPIKLPVKRVFIHHTAIGQCNTYNTCSATVRAIQNYHVNKNGWSDIAYNFLIGGDGRVYVGRGWDRVGAHTRGYNENICIAFIGDFSKDEPPVRMLDAAKKLITCGIQSKKIAQSYGLYAHRDARDTDSPGDALYNIIKQWPHYGALGTLKRY